MIKSFCCDKKPILYYIDKEVFCFLCSYHFEKDFISDATKDITSLKRIESIVNHIDEWLSISKVKVNEINEIKLRITQSYDIYKSQLTENINEIKLSIDNFNINLLKIINETYLPYDKEKIDDIVEYINETIERNNKYSDNLKMNLYDNLRKESSIEFTKSNKSDNIDINEYLDKTKDYLNSILSSKIIKLHSVDNIRPEINEIIKGISTISELVLSIISKLKGNKQIVNNSELDMIIEDDILSNLHMRINKLSIDKNIKPINSEFNQISESSHQMQIQQHTTPTKIQQTSNLNLNLNNISPKVNKDSSNNIKYKERSARKEIFSAIPSLSLSEKDNSNYNLKYKQDDNLDIDSLKNKQSNINISLLNNKASSIIKDNSPFIKFHQFNHIVSLSDTYDLYILNTKNNKISKIDNEKAVNTIKKYSSSKGINIENGKFLIVSSAPKDNKLSSNSFILSYEMKTRQSTKSIRDDLNEADYEYESFLEEYSLTSFNKKKFNLVSFQILNKSNTYDNIVFNLGGLKTFDCEYSFFSNKTKKWKDFCSLNDVRTNASCAVINKRLFIFGGSNSEKQNKLGDGYLNSMEYIELEEFIDDEKREKMKWNLIECDILDVINKSAFGVLNSTELLNSIIIFGGFNNTNSDKDVLSDKVIMIDFDILSTSKVKLSVNNFKERLFEKTCFINFNFLKSGNNENLFYSCSFNNKYYCYNAISKDVRMLS